MNDVGTVSLGMQEYLEEISNAFGEDITHKVPTLVSSKLFEVIKSKLLYEKKSEIFHHILAKLLYVSKRVLLDLSIAITFLCTRDSKSAIEDWEKLR